MKSGFSVPVSDNYDWTIFSSQQHVDVYAFMGGLPFNSLDFYTPHHYTTSFKSMRKILPIFKEKTLILVAICLLSFSLSVGFFVEFWEGQVPCTLCFLLRICMMGTAFSLYLNLLKGSSRRYYGFALLWSLLGLCVSLRHLALNICKPLRANAFFFGPFQMYTWSFIISFCSILGIAALLCLHGKEPTNDPSKDRGAVYFSSALLFLMLSIGFYSVVSKQGWVF